MREQFAFLANDVKSVPLKCYSDNFEALNQKKSGLELMESERRYQPELYSSSDIKVNPWLSESIKDNLWLPRTFSEASGNTLVHASSEPVLFSKRLHEKPLNSKPLVTSYDTSSLYLNSSNDLPLTSKFRPLTPWISDRANGTTNYGYGIQRKTPKGSFRVLDLGSNKPFDYNTLLGKPGQLQASQSLQNLTTASQLQEKCYHEPSFAQKPSLPFVQNVLSMKVPSLNGVDNSEPQERSGPLSPPASNGLPQLVDAQRLYLSSASKDGKKRRNSWINEISTLDNPDHGKEKENNHKPSQRHERRSSSRRSNKDKASRAAREAATSEEVTTTAVSALRESEGIANTYGLALPGDIQIGSGNSTKPSGRKVKSARSRRKSSLSKEEKASDSSNTASKKSSNELQEKGKSTEVQKSKPDTLIHRLSSLQNTVASTSASTPERTYEKLDDSLKEVPIKGRITDYSLLTRRKNSSMHRHSTLANYNVRSRQLIKSARQFHLPNHIRTTTLISKGADGERKVLPVDTPYIRETDLKHRSGRQSVPFPPSSKDSSVVETYPHVSTKERDGRQLQMRIENPEAYLRILRQDRTASNQETSRKSSMRRTPATKKKRVTFNTKERTVFVYTPVQVH